MSVNLKEFTMRLLAQHMPAQESITFQSTAFFKELILTVIDLKKEKATEIADSEAAGRLSIVVEHHTGMKVKIDIGQFDPCVEIPHVNKNNPLINQFYRNYTNSSDGLKLIRDADGAASGTVNMVTSKVSGIWSKVETCIHMPITMFVGTKFSAEEISAIILHELGHLFTYFEYMCRSVTTNQVLAGLAQTLDGGMGIEQREAVLITAAKALQLNELDTEKLAKSTNKKVAEIVVITNVIKKTESELGSNIYDLSTWEYLSDQFAARHGAGRHLVTALDKLYRTVWNISFRSTPAFLAWEAVKLLTLVFGLPGIAVMLIMIDSSGDGSYDRPGARIKRVRDQIVQNLKDKDLSKDDHERLTADLIEIDAVLKCANDRYQFVEYVWNLMSPTQRKNLSQEKLQKDLEDLAVNELFVKSAELKQYA